MTSYGQRFFFTNTKQTTPALPAQVYDMVETGAVTGTATTLTWSSTTTSYKRVNPYANNSTDSNPPATGSAASNFGWRLLRADVDASEPRVIAAGSWSVLISIRTGSYALLALNPSYAGVAIVFRIASDGSATEIARGTASARAVAASTSNGLTCVVNMPEVTLAVGETLQVECYVQGAATASALGQVTNNVVTVQTATSYLDLGNPLRTVATRSASESTSTTDSVIRTQTDVRRSADAEIPPTDSASRLVTAARAPSESLTQTVSAPFTATYPRSISEALPAATDVATRTQTDYRRASDVASDVVDSSSRRIIDFRRAATQVDAIVDSAQKLVVYGRTARYDFVPGDEPLIDPTRSITGVVRDAAGNPYLGAATVYLVRDDNSVVASTLSSTTDGSYVFWRNSYDTHTYYVAAFTDGALPREGVTERGLVPS